MDIAIVVLIGASVSLGLLITLYIHQSAQHRIRGGGARNTTFLFGRVQRSCTTAFGLSDDVIRRLPSFQYSVVKRGKGSIECSVCLNEFKGDEMLRRLPKCSHVFHSTCIDSWLSAHTTCPVCRASLVPRPGQDFDFTAVQIFELGDRPNVEPSTKMRIGGLYTRSHSTGRSRVQVEENCMNLSIKIGEDEERKEGLNWRLKRSRSHGMLLPKERSERMSYIQCDRFDRNAWEINSA